MRARGTHLRIAIDIDSTLHHYWDLLSAAARRRFGVDLPYERQLTWGITSLRAEQLRVCIQETHGADVIAAGEPYPDAVETVNRWAREGHFIHVTSHRAPSTHDATQAWLEAIGLRHDELYCSFDKVTRCVDIDIDVLIDDSPVNLGRAIEADITPATILHPWNKDVCEEEAVICGSDWLELARKLDPVLAR